MFTESEQESVQPIARPSVEESKFTEFTVTEMNETQEQAPIQTKSDMTLREESKESSSSGSSSSEEESSSDEEEEKKELVEAEPIKVKYELMNNLLVSFFSIHSRIVEKSNTFEIGPIKFLVSGTSPYKLGKVTAETRIRCKNCVSERAELDYIEIIPMRRN